MATNPNELVSAYYSPCSEMEGNIPWMYLDGRGNVTAAIGQMLPNVDAALLLPWQSSDLSKSASPVQIASDFARVKSMIPGKSADFYRDEATSPLLRATDIDAMLQRECAGSIAELVARFPEFWSWPQTAQLALLDMIFNLGTGGLFGSEMPKKDGFPHLAAAAKLENWTVCAEECQRGGIGPVRNTWTREQFNAAAMTKVAA
jgi:GH24 family phage-related lysozyme (muramidase)